LSADECLACLGAEAADCALWLRSRALLRIGVRTLFRGFAAATGLEKRPGTAYVAAGNHISICDPPLLISFGRRLAAIGGRCV
jgi:hypothetical protein